MHSLSQHFDKSPFTFYLLLPLNSLSFVEFITLIYYKIKD